MHLKVTGLPGADQRRDRQFLHVDVGADQRGELRRQLADEGRLDAGGIDQARHFGRAIVRQRGDAAIVAHVAVDHRRLAGPHRVHDRGGIFLRLSLTSIVSAVR